MPEALVIDHSAHDAFAFCPAKWYELYVNKRRKRWPSGQRKDALCIGSLVHEGLRVWQETHTIEIPNSIIDEVTPDRETLSLAQELVLGYARHYPAEQWPLIRCEQPLTWKIGYENEDRRYDPIYGLAKLDAYFYVLEDTQLESGVEGLNLTLSRGWWIHEYKTKSPYDPIGLYMQSWETNLQASYQILALESKLHEPVQGVLVNVIEKPKRYIPKRKCMSCQETYEYATWLPTGTGLYACPICGVQRKLEPLKRDQPTINPNYFRIVVVRSREELDRDAQIIKQTACAMNSMRSDGLNSCAWTKRNCVSMMYKSACDYFSPHTKSFDTREDEYSFETPSSDYRGLYTIEE